LKLIELNVVVVVASAAERRGRRHKNTRPATRRRRASSKKWLVTKKWPNRTLTRKKLNLQKGEKNTIGSIRTLTWSECTQFDLALFVRDSFNFLAEEGVQPLLVGRVGDHDEDGEEDEGHDGLPDLYLVRGDPFQHDEKPDVGKDGEQSSHHEHDDLGKFNKSYNATNC